MAAQSGSCQLGTTVRVQLQWKAGPSGETIAHAETIDNLETKLYIGRRGHFEVRLDGVDDKHAHIRMRQDGAVVLVDSGSTSGTSISTDKGATFVSLGDSTLDKNARRDRAVPLQMDAVIKCGTAVIKVVEVTSLTSLLVARRLTLQQVDASGEAAGEPFDLHLSEVCIGRASREQRTSRADLMVVTDTDRHVSRLHCKLLSQRNGLHVKGMSNKGTFIRRAGMPASEWIAVPEGETDVCAAGDMLRLAESVFISVQRRRAAAVAAAPAATGAPAPVTGLFATSRTDTRIQLAWDAPEAASNVLAYHVSLAPSATGPWDQRCTVDTCAAVLDELKPSSVYFVRIVAQNAEECSVPCELECRTLAVGEEDPDSETLTARTHASTKRV